MPSYREVCIAQKGKIDDLHARLARVEGALRTIEAITMEQWDSCGEMAVAMDRINDTVSACLRTDKERDEPMGEVTPGRQAHSRIRRAALTDKGSRATEGNSMNVQTYDELAYHRGHDIVVMTYADENATVRCKTCGTVLFEISNGEDGTMGELSEKDAVTRQYHERVVRAQGSEIRDLRTRLARAEERRNVAVRDRTKAEKALARAEDVARRKASEIAPVLAKQHLETRRRLARTEGLLEPEAGWGDDVVDNWWKARLRAVLADKGRDEQGEQDSAHVSSEPLKPRAKQPTRTGR